MGGTIQAGEGRVTEFVLQQAAIGTAKFRVRMRCMTLKTELHSSQVDQTRANLEAAQDSYNKASARLTEGQCEITKTIASMTKLSLENAALKEIVPILIKVVEAFTSAYTSSTPPGGRLIICCCSTSWSILADDAILLQRRVAHQRRDETPSVFVGQEHRCNLQFGPFWCQAFR